jgi:hypothetical protein
MPQEAKILGPTEILFMRRSRSKYMQAHSFRSWRTEQHDDDGMVPLSIASLQTEGISKPHFVSACMTLREKNLSHPPDRINPYPVRLIGLVPIPFTRWDGALDLKKAKLQYYF